MGKIAELREQLLKKERSCTELTESYLRAIEKKNPVLNAYVKVTPEEALSAAKRVDEKLAAGEPLAPLEGIPMALKDNLSTKGLETTCCSKILKGYVPIYDATVWAELKRKNAVLLGKVNMDEFAMGSASETSCFGPPKNPFDTGHVAGGSSGGAASAVAGGLAAYALGSDTGGSIRQPASLCGCTGIKPTYGRVSRYGLIAYGSSLDQIGPLGRSVADCARVLGVIAGHDQRDATCDPRPVDDYDAAAAAPALKGARLGLPKEFYAEGLAPEVRAVCEKAIETARAEGAEIVEVSLPHTNAAIATYYIIAMAEASSNLARFDGVRYGHRAADVKQLAELYVRSRSEGFGQEVKRRILLGTYVLSSGYYDAYFRKAAQVRRLIRDEYLAALEQCDALLAPVSPVTAWEMGCHSADPLQMYLMDAYTLSLNLAGLPGLSLPVGMAAESRMPVGMQLIGKAFDEAGLFRLGAGLEAALPGIGLAQL